MRQLTEHLLLLARGKKTVQMASTDLSRLVGGVVDRAREHSPDINMYFETSGETTVLGDEMLLARLVSNLIANGLKHASGTDMQVDVRAQQQMVTLSVRDAGPGVPEAALPRLVEPFYRADRARAGDGNGLGLSIVRRVAEIHSASLSIENGRPNGLLVTVTFAQV